MQKDDVPLYRVGITYSLKKGIKGKADDFEAEYDHIETVEAIKNAIEKHNCRVELFETTENLYENLKKSHIDIIFNIAEGMNGRGREAQVPAILDYLNIPYTGSDETTLGVALDKALTKRTVTPEVITPRFQLFQNTDEPLYDYLHFPLIVKPNAEGSSKGISNIAIAHNNDELYTLLKKGFDFYNEYMLVEEYIHGREFTVGIIGNGKDTKIFSPMEIIYKNSNINKDEVIYSYEVKQNYQNYIEYNCPAAIDNKTEKLMKTFAKTIYETLGCRDFSRVDFKISNDGKVYFIEINPIPGLAPDYSDYPMITKACGIDYDSLIINILNCALARYKMSPVLN